MNDDEGTAKGWLRLERVARDRPDPDSARFADLMLRVRKMAHERIASLYDPSIRNEEERAEQRARLRSNLDTRLARGSFAPITLTPTEAREIIAALAPEEPRRRGRKPSTESRSQSAIDKQTRDLHIACGYAQAVGLLAIVGIGHLRDVRAGCVRDCIALLADEFGCDERTVRRTIESESEFIARAIGEASPDNK